MSNKSIGIKKIAMECNVSVATVSRVLNNTANVSSDTKKLVLDTIEKFGYKPNLRGRNLRTGKTNMILVLISSFNNTFCNSIIHSIDKIAEKHGYYTMTCVTNGNYDKEKYYINFALDGLFDGLIILNSSLTSNELIDISKKIPTVQCNEYIEKKVVPYVAIDNKKASYDAVTHLIENGRKKIVFHTVKNNLVSTKERLIGYKTALEKHDIPFNENLIVYGNYGYHNSMEEFRKFINKNIEFDGVFALSDKMAVAVSSVLISKNIRIPEDIEVIGFDNSDLSYMANPSLTTISQPYLLLGNKAFELLFKVMNNEKPNSIILPHKLCIRKSTIN